ncbi:MAG: YciI family protein [Rickettsiales bacterium]
MQFVLIARDGTDEGALARRMAARAGHIATIERLKPHMLMGAATLNDAGQMNGSVMVVEFPDRAGLDAWLATEPYLLGDVWREISIEPCAVGPSFLK